MQSRASTMNSPNKRIECAPFGRPTCRRRGRLLAAQRRRYASPVAMTKSHSPCSPFVIALIVAAATLHLAGCARSQPAANMPSQCIGSAPVNREVVLSFYRLGLVGHKPRDAFEQFATPGMVEHKPDVPGGTRTSVVNYLEELISELPQAQWEILRVAAEGDLVFLHAKFVPEPGAEPYAIADVFRLQDCKIVEHWDVVAPPRKGESNPNSRF